MSLRLYVRSPEASKRGQPWNEIGRPADQKIGFEIRSLLLVGLEQGTEVKLSEVSEDGKNETEISEEEVK